MKRVIGITGGIASGKSNVANIIKSMGYTVIDADKISIELSKVDMPLYNAIVEAFGPQFVLDNRELDRKKLGKLIFNNSAAKLLLDSKTHPIIAEEIKNQIKSAPDGLVFIEVPLLYEAKLNKLCEFVICVFLKKRLQIERLMARDGIDEDYALAKIHSQMDLYMKKSLADYVVDSSGEFEQTEKQVKDIIYDIENNK